MVKNGYHSLDADWVHRALPQARSSPTTQSCRGHSTVPQSVVVVISVEKPATAHQSSTIDYIYIHIYIIIIIIIMTIIIIIDVVIYIYIYIYIYVQVYI